MKGRHGKRKETFMKVNLACMWLLDRLFYLLFCAPHLHNNNNNNNELNAFKLNKHHMCNICIYIYIYIYIGL